MESAVKDADIIVFSTTATQPVLFAAWLRHGVHINSIASATPQVRELDSAVIGKIKNRGGFKGSRPEEVGDPFIPLAQGQITTADIYGEVGEIAAGSKPGRTDGRETTVYKSVGLAYRGCCRRQMALCSGFGGSDTVGGGSETRNPVKAYLGVKKTWGM